MRTGTPGRRTILRPAWGPAVTSRTACILRNRFYLLRERPALEAEANHGSGVLVFHHVGLHGAEHGLQLLVVAGRQIDPQDAGIVIAEQHPLAALIVHGQETPKVFSQSDQILAGLRENAPMIAPALLQ